MIEMQIIWKYLDEQIANAAPLPPEFANEVEILCRDCHQVLILKEILIPTLYNFLILQLSKVMFNSLGLKCGHCGGYNTCIERGSALNPEAFLASPHIAELIEAPPDDETDDADEADEAEESN